MLRMFAICLLMGSFGLGIHSQDFSNEKYKLRTLAELTALNSPNVSGTKVEFLVSGDWFPSQVRLKYTGTSRNMSTSHKSSLLNWKKSFQSPDQTTALFEKEFLFQECQTDYWLPVQQPVTAYFGRELKPGDMVTLYLIFGGGMKVADRWDFLFLVNEFSK